jgi:hypothetical protein
MTSTQGSGPKQALRPAGKFPVFKTAWAACRFLFRNWRAFAIAALVPLLLSLAFDLWSDEWTGSFWRDQSVRYLGGFRPGHPTIGVSSGTLWRLTCFMQ